MAYVTATRGDRWEIRESRSTRKGPRSRTLATFAELDDDVCRIASSRASTPLSEGELKRAALRAGAPVAPEPADRAARDLLAEIALGRVPRRALRRLLDDAIGNGTGKPSDAERAAAAWIAAPTAARAEALQDLLLLADQLPAPRQRRGQLDFPRLDSR